MLTNRGQGENAENQKQTDLENKRHPICGRLAYFFLRDWNGFATVNAWHVYRMSGLDKKDLLLFKLQGREGPSATNQL